MKVGTLIAVTVGEDEDWTQVRIPGSSESLSQTSQADVISSGGTGI